MIASQQLLMVAYGLGRDSTALLIELFRRRRRPDAILWANTGSEKSETYAYLPIINEWLVYVGFPTVTVVQYDPVRAPYHTIEGNMVLNATDCTQPLLLPLRHLHPEDRCKCRRCYRKGRERAF